MKIPDGPGLLSGPSTSVRTTWRLPLMVLGTKRPRPPPCETDSIKKRARLRRGVKLRARGNVCGPPRMARRALRASDRLSTATRRTRRGMRPAACRPVGFLRRQRVASCAKERIGHPSTCWPGFLPWITTTMKRGAKIACQASFSGASQATRGDETFAGPADEPPTGQPPAEHPCSFRRTLGLGRRTPRQPLTPDTAPGPTGSVRRDRGERQRSSCPRSPGDGPPGSRPRRQRRN